MKFNIFRPLLLIFLLSSILLHFLYASGSEISLDDQSQLNEGVTNNFCSITQYIPENRDTEFKALYEYIRKNYPRVSEDDAQDISTCLVDLSAEHQLDPKFVAALIAKESAFNKQAISSTGAKGLGQIKDFNFKALDISNPYDIKENSNGTIRYIKQLLNSWKGKTDQVAFALASYFRGYTNMKRNESSYDSKSDRYVNDTLKIYNKLVEHLKKVKESQPEPIFTPTSNITAEPDIPTSPVEPDTAPVPDVETEN